MAIGRVPSRLYILSYLSKQCGTNTLNNYHQFVEEYREGGGKDEEKENDISDQRTQQETKEIEVQFLK